MTNEEAGRNLDAAEENLKAATIFLRSYDKFRNEGEEIKIAISVPRAVLAHGGTAFMNACNAVLREIVNMDDVVNAALKHLADKAGAAMDDMLKAQNDQRERLGLPPLVKADGDASEAPSLITLALGPPEQHLESAGEGQADETAPPAPPPPPQPYKRAGRRTVGAQQS